MDVSSQDPEDGTVKVAKHWIAYVLVSCRLPRGLPLPACMGAYIGPKRIKVLAINPKL